MNTQELGYLNNWSPLYLDQLPCKIDLLDIKHRPRAKADTAFLGGNATRTCASNDQRTLEISYSRKNRQHHAASRRCCVGPRLSQRSKPRANIFDALRNIGRSRADHEWI